MFNLKLKFATAGVAVASLVIAGSAFAATFSNVQFDNGDVKISGPGGSTSNATFRLVVPANEVIEKIELDLLGDNLAPVCHDVSETLGYQEGTHEVTLPVKHAPNTGTYTLAWKLAGIYGGDRSVDCNNNVVGSNSFGGAVRTVATGTTSGNLGSTNKLDAILASLTALIGKMSDLVKPTPTPSATPTASATPAVNATCQAYAQAKAGTQMGVYNDANVRLQGFLLSQGASIPALKAGASFGFYGPQTASAVSWFQAINHCN